MFHRQHGVALVITLIMLAVITFMAVTFLAVSRREAGSVTVTRDQTTARLAADTALERVKAELQAVILGTTNAYNFGLQVSTNFVNWDGFDPNLPYDYRTNVNYGWQRNGAPLTANDALQNLANLLLNARPPVFITNRFFANSNDFRFYLDLNRNGRYDTNGVWPEINSFGLPVTYTSTNGATVTNYLYFVGDPEWIGVLERPDRPHSATNRFIARYAYIVVPSGKTLDLNYIHNHAKLLVLPNGDGFLRNQGVGTWEINLAAFLADLNTNLWIVPPPQGYAIVPSYEYWTNLDFPSKGAGFQDAFQLLRSRHQGSVTVLDSVQTLFGNPGKRAFETDFVDGYTGGPLMTTYLGWSPDQDVVTRPWHGADNAFQFFNTQDLYDTKKTVPLTTFGLNLTDRLKIAGTNVSSYDRYTFYRMLSQLGTDSAAEPHKMNLNYVNVGGLSATNFVSWNEPNVVISGTNVSGARLFFTTVADRLVRRITEYYLNTTNGPAQFLAHFGTNQPFGALNIPVTDGTNSFYAPSVHRMLQLALNIYDATQTNKFPTVFRPVFTKAGNYVAITDFEEVPGNVPLGDPYYFRQPVDSSNVIAGVNIRMNVHGVPWIVGAKKGFPNFNELTMQTLVTITRKVLLEKETAASTNIKSIKQMYVVGISNMLGVEAWNSYLTRYPRQLQIVGALDWNPTVSNRTQIVWPVAGPSWRSNVFITNLVANTWAGYNGLASDPSSFRIPAQVRSNMFGGDDKVYWQVPGGGYFIDKSPGFERFQLETNIPPLVIRCGGRLRFIMYDVEAGRLVDYVTLSGLEHLVDLSRELVPDPLGRDPCREVWRTNGVPARGQFPATTQGILNQIMLSLGGSQSDLCWKNAEPVRDKDDAISKFMSFLGVSPGVKQTNLLMQAPYSPSYRFLATTRLEANDPLVHYTVGDLSNAVSTNDVGPAPLNMAPDVLKSLGNVNRRYRPWNKEVGESEVDNLAIKDPMVRRSDDWNFPTNKFPNIGWLGRVHRGSPWQTVYLKSPDADAGAWAQWSGNRDLVDALVTRPVTDRALLDIFTTGFWENATRGQLSINQSGLAAWSAVFAGMIVLSNNVPDDYVQGLQYAPSPLLPCDAFPIPPAGIDVSNAAIWKIVSAMNNIRRTNYLGGAFHQLGDILSVPQLTDQSPFLNLSTVEQRKFGINDTMYEWLPQQMLSLIQVGEPRFVVYSYGQTLRPAPNSIIRGGPFDLMCTNYQVTAEVATRAVMRIEGAPTGTTSTNAPPARPRVVIEKFNLLPPDL